MSTNRYAIKILISIITVLRILLNSRFWLEVYTHSLLAKNEWLLFVKFKYTPNQHFYIYNHFRNLNAGIRMVRQRKIISSQFHANSYLKLLTKLYAYRQAFDFTTIIYAPVDSLNPILLHNTGFFVFFFFQYCHFSPTSILFITCSSLHPRQHHISSPFYQKKKKKNCCQVQVHLLLTLEVSHSQIYFM